MIFTAHNNYYSKIICSCVVVNFVVHCLSCVFPVVTLVTKLYVCHCLHCDENVFGLPI